ncbi:NAD(P)/FAD-dependent oxidoreductase [Flavihumibacter sp. R14]|nr:NAD(P)/FAD-dependent oxidoreductase [Flavihumibacter soli]
MGKRDFDAVVVGSGPNGLAAAIAMQQEGLNVLIIEGKDTIGGGLRSAELTLPGFTHDICSAVHPLAFGSPFFSKLPLQKHGLEYIFPAVAAAHPFRDGSAAFLTKSIDETARWLTKDDQTYATLFTRLLKDWPGLMNDLLGPLRIPENPAALAKFGMKALLPATVLARNFQTTGARALVAGMAAHSMLPLTYIGTSAIALVLMASGHEYGWPIPKGGSASIANALASYFTALGGRIETGRMITSMNQLPSSHAVLFDITPKQLLKIAGHKFSTIYKWQLERYRYGMGVFKMDWALDEPIPFKNSRCRQAGTVHLGSTMAEIADSEQQTWQGRHPEKPFVLLAQPSISDPSRAPAGKHSVWAYCHVPKNSNADMTEAIESQVERYAPGFKDRILARHVMNSRDMECYNPNYIGGDINGGAIDIGQLFTRPALRWSPYRTSAKGLYICSSSTPPGGGVHGMCGYHAAKRALKDVFQIS